MMNQVLFLDIDGVMLTPMYSHFLELREKEFGIPASDEFNYFLDPYPVHLLRTLAREMPLNIVITSQWRIAHDLSEWRQLWQQRQYPGKIVGVTPRLEIYQRSKEIEVYVQEHHIRYYAIVDDLPREAFSEEQQAHFVPCNPKTGFDEAACQRCRELLTEDMDEELQRLLDALRNDEE
jgi:hypothetical protein